jgi:hypothetical protein
MKIRLIVAACLLLSATPGASGAGREGSAAVQSKAKMSRLREGVWGGAHARLDVKAGGAVLELDCAHGRVEGALRLDRRGRFDARGTYTAEAGAQRLDEDAPDGVTPKDTAEAVPARYEGRLVGDALTIEVTLTETGTRIGTFTLRHGRPPTLTKCN